MYNRNMIYFDWAATALPREDLIREALEESFKYSGNPNSTHNFGLKSKERLEECREEVSELLNCNSSSIYFTSGATESNNLVTLSFLKKHGQGEAITSSIEHPSNSGPLGVLKNFGWKIREVSPKESGEINLKKILKSLNENTRFISLIHVHNETGKIQDLNLIISKIREASKDFSRRVFIHIDSVQGAGKIPLNLKELDIDSLSISGHKFGSPAGIGILYLKETRDVIYRGGGQEGGIRPGTQSIFNAIAITKCLKEAITDQNSESRRLKELMESILAYFKENNIKTIPASRTPDDSSFVPNILSFTVPPIGGEVFQRVLNEKGFAISTGSACSSNRKSSTKGILSMGISEEEGFSSVRLSIGRLTTNEDVVNLLKAIKETIEELAP